MEKRKFISQEYQYNQSKVPFAVTVHAENTRLSTIERFNGPWRYDSDTGEQIIFTINYEEFGVSHTTKVRHRCEIDNEGLYVQYALASMECCNTYEEYYKAALLIQKNMMRRQIEAFEEAEKKFNKTGYWPWPYSTNVNMYKRWFKSEKKIFESIDITEKDLSFFKAFTFNQE